VLTGAQAGVKLTLPKADVSEKTIRWMAKRQPDHRASGRRQRHLPVFMFFHGGGWVLGDYPTHERLVRDLVEGSGAVAVFVNYTPSPEAHYPTAINQAYAATKWVAEHGKEINVDGKRLAVAGNSVGGNMAAVVSLMAKDKGTPAIKYPGAAVACDRCQLRNRLVQAVRRRALPHSQHDEVVLGQLHHRSEATRRDLCLAAARHTAIN
jgi:acetyl esterase/lipase